MKTRIRPSITEYSGRSTISGSLDQNRISANSLILCLIFGIGIGLLMATLFWKDDLTHDAQADALFAEKAHVSRPALGVLLSLVALLIAGTLKLWPLTADLISFKVPLFWPQAWQDTLFDWVPYDASKGEEGVSFQGSVLIALLLMIAATAKRGLDNITEGANNWTWVALGLTASTLLIASMRLTPEPGTLTFTFTGRVFGVALTLLSVWYFARKLPTEDWQGWLWEAWCFVKQIFVVLVVGVFIVGMVRQVIQPEWIESLAGSNTVLANAIAVGFGVFMYFPTLVEVPVARMFLDLGMHPGPLLAYLMADPELSLQSMLMVAAVIGRKKTAAYVGFVASFSIVAGLLYGAWVDGTNWLILGAGMAASLAITGAIYQLIRYQRKQTAS
ncbi:permease [Pseudomonas fluorescens]